MCDLIDLKSPDGKSLPGVKLASPLIPAPQQTPTTCKNVEGPSGPSFEKRTSLDNNPFDNVLHKTVEYMRKQEDPFEVVLEKALSYEHCNLASKALVVKDDFTPKKRRYSDILKMNKTLDDSMTRAAADISGVPEKVSPVMTENIAIGKNHSLGGLAVPQIRVETAGLDSSILNQSAMNDSLTETSGVEDSLLKSVIGSKINERLRCAPKEAAFFLGDEIPKLHNLRRSLSQGDKSSPRKFRLQRTLSTLEGAKISDESSLVASVPSIIFDDVMNKAFARTLSRCNLSSLSNVSSISKVGSVSLRLGSSDSSSALSSRTADRAFIENYRSEGSTGSYREFCETDGSSRLASRGSSVGTSPIEDDQREKDLNNLILKYTDMMRKSSESTTNEALSRTNSVGPDITDNSNAEDKLIDADIFVPSKKSPDCFQRKSVSSTSSDSVFVDSDTIEKSIFSEAKTLARTFEELAIKTGSSSTSSDDLINSRPRWNFDALPASDDEAMDLIELQKSPEKSDRSNDPDENQKSTSISDANSEKSESRDSTSSKFRDPENKLIASTLLMDLEKLVKSEANAEAEGLLRNLEKALNVKCPSNVDLLTTYLAEKTESPARKKSENTEETKNEKSEKNPEKINSENSEIEKSSSPEINGKIEIPINNDVPAIENGHGNVSESIEKVTDRSLETQHNHVTDDQKVAAEILVGLGKLLSGEKKDPAMGSLLKNLGIALNLAFSNNCDQNHTVETVVKKTERVSTPVKNRIATPPRKSTGLSIFSKNSNRRSLNLNAKTSSANERGTRKSTSVTQTPTSTTPSISRLSNTLLSTDKTKGYLKDGRKRFSSDPTSDVQSKNIALKPAVSELARQDKPSSTVGVKSKLKKKPEPITTSKRGPMKATLPLGNMQRQGSLVKRESPLNGSVTPPGHETSSGFAVSTSTPFPVVHLAIPPKKCSKSKPVASSTPDEVGSKNLRRSTSNIPQSPGKNAFSCNISPVTSKRSEEVTDRTTPHNNSISSRTSKIGTPSKSRQTSHLPKLSPVLGNKNVSPRLNRNQRRSEPFHSFLPKSSVTPKATPERRGSDSAVSPLNNSNKFGSTVKPLNLISKLGRRKAGVAEKENHA